VGDLKDPRLIYLKGFLFLVIGILASTILLIEHPDLRVLLLVAIIVWAFARFYYFAFYVVEHYVDGEFKFAGLIPFFMYILKSRKTKPDANASPTAEQSPK
jgi:hypothetical protein